MGTPGGSIDVQPVARRCGGAADGALRTARPLSVKYALQGVCDTSTPPLDIDPRPEGPGDATRRDATTMADVGPRSGPHGAAPDPLPVVARARRPGSRRGRASSIRCSVTGLAPGWRCRRERRRWRWRRRGKPLRSGPGSGPRRRRGTARLVCRPGPWWATASSRSCADHRSRYEDRSASSRLMTGMNSASALGFRVMSYSRRSRM